jgi:hypothetical protein
LWLECERWYVGTAVPEGGVGGLLGVAEQLDVGAAAPKLCQCGGSSEHYQKPVFSPRPETYRKIRKTVRIIVPVSRPTGKYRQANHDGQIYNA